MTTTVTIPQTPPEYDQTRVIERPDGFYWQDKLTDRLYGPFPTMLEAVQDMQYRGDTGYEEGESLEDAEAEIGMSDWIDPETGEPAEGSPPHLNDN
ncbi:MAG: hypothetical protein Q8J90_07595 [Gallionella sp.]|nr:hypothetical protein [Gallionella sp.]